MEDNNLCEQMCISLGLRNVPDKEWRQVCDNINKFYNITEFSYFTPHIRLFSNFINNSKALNNKYNLFQLISQKKRFGITGYSYNAKIKTRSNNIFHNKVFVKEVPFFEPNNLDLYYNSLNINNKEFSPMGQAVYNGLYDLNSPSNIELFITYITSKLVEENVSPHFCRYFGSYYVNLDKYTYDITSSETILDQAEELLNSDIDVKYYEDSSGIFLEYPNVPAYLIVTEYSRFSIDYLIENNILNYNLICSCVFQIFTAIITMKNIFGIKHNDLHFGNIMVVETKEEYLYYQYNSIFYKVPTYGYMFKIIDWGRSTYNFNKLKGDNSVFSGPGECFEQYIYTRLNHSGLEPIELDNNDWTDIVMFSHSVLYEYKDYLKDTNLQRLLTKLITSTDKEAIEIKEFDWNLYIEITVKEFNIKPNEILTNRVFNDFKVNQRGKQKKKLNIPVDSNIYKIAL